MRIKKNNFMTVSDGAKIYFEEHGTAGRSIVMVPGFLCTTKFFQRNVPVLAQKHRVVAMDPRGQGYSSKTLAGNTVSRMAQDIAELIEYLDLEDPIVLGWSMGASVVLNCVTRFAKRKIGGVVLVDGSLYPMSDGAWNKHRARNYNIANWMATYYPLYFDREKFFQEFTERISNGKMTQEDRAWILEECMKTLPWTAIEQHYDFCLTDSLPLLQQLSCPVAFVGGTSQSYGLDMLYEYASRVGVPHKIYPFTESGHLLFYEEADKFNTVMEEFAQSLT